MQVLQILEVEVHNIIVRGLPDMDKGSGMYMVSAQLFNIWRPLADTGDELPNNLDVFVYQDPVEFDILAATGMTAECRGQMFAWSVGESDVEGCVCC